MHHVHVGTVFQSHGAPTHLSCSVRASLDREFPDRRIGRVRGGGIRFPHSHSRFNPSEFFWVFVKDIIYHEKVKNVKELCNKINRAADCISNEM